MTVDTKRLRELAEKATPGPWEIWTSNSVRRITAYGKQDGGVLSAIAHRDGCPDMHGNNREHDLAFIAAANPQAVIALLDDNLQLTRNLIAMTSARDVYYNEMRDIAAECNRHGAERDNLRAENTRLRAELAEVRKQAEGRGAK